MVKTLARNIHDPECGWNELGVAALDPQDTARPAAVVLCLFSLLSAFWGGYFLGGLVG